MKTRKRVFHVCLLGYWFYYLFGVCSSYFYCIRTDRLCLFCISLFNLKVNICVRRVSYYSMSYLPSTFVFWLKYLSLYVFAPVMFLTTWLLSIFSSLVWELFPCTYHLVPNFIRVRSIYCFSELQKQLSLCFRRQDIVWCRPYITNSRLTLCNNVYVTLYCLCYFAGNNTVIRGLFLTYVTFSNGLE